MVALEARGEPVRARPVARHLPVVRVQPRSQIREDEEQGGSDFTMADQGYETMEDRADDLEEEDDGEGGDQRPVLKLHESGRSAVFSVSDSSAAPRKAINLASVNERLPVVPMANAPPMSGGDAAMPPPFPVEEQPTSSAEEVVAEARRQIRSGQCGPAINALGGMIASSPEHPLAAEAMLMRAQCFRRQGAHLRALGEAERMARRYPSSGQRPAALMEMAESYASLGDMERARELFGQVMRQYPQSPAARRATSRVQELGRGGGRAREE
jgi:TolA-binding protein